MKTINVNIKNYIPDKTDVVVGRDGNNITVTISEKPTAAVHKTLGEVNCGDTVTIGNREYIVLGHGKETTAVITADIIKDMKFGDSNDYRTSYVRHYINKGFYKELVAEIGKENIIRHKIRLEADDGTNKGVVAFDNVSLLTGELYRRYRPYIKKTDKSYWLATPVSVEDAYYSRRVCYVGSDGVPDRYGCGCSSGVRPFLILSSSILIS